jgi:AraC-like DNA-binding protein
MVTDVGYYPDAQDHRMNRTRGTDETVVIVCTAGTGWARVGDQVHQVTARNALVIPRGSAHEYGASATRPWTIWWAHLVGTDVAELVQTMEVTPERPIVPIRNVERAVALLDEILTVLERDQSPARLVTAAGAAWKLLAQTSADRVLPAPGDPLQRAMTYLAERLDGSVKVADLAGFVGVSPSHLTALFRRATGGGILAHQQALRMARARQLLDGTDARINEIAREVGYDDPFYFSRHFRRHHGVTPTQYRERDAPA